MLVEKSNFTVTRMVRLLGVSRSGFYAWLGRVPSQRAIRAERIEAKVAWFHGDSDEVSGSPKILADLRDDGEVISRKTVAKTMRKLHLKGVCPKRWRTTTLIDHAGAYPVDAAKRDWDKGELNRVWVGDITYLRTWEGWLYLATVIDAHSRRVIGWAIDEHMRADLVQDAWSWRSHSAGTCLRRLCSILTGAPVRLGPDHRLRRSKRAHPLHGVHRFLLGQRHGRIVLRHLEDRVLLPPVWPTKKRARLEVGNWIEDRYNRRRRHSSIGQISPVDFELQYSRQTADSQEAA